MMNDECGMMNEELTEISDLRFEISTGKPFVTHHSALIIFFGG
jgi:hypothetical protein